MERFLERLARLQARHARRCHRVRRRRGLEIRQERLILLVRADPEPHDDMIVLDQPDDAIAAPHSCGVDRLRVVDALEVQAGMMGIAGK